MVEATSLKNQSTFLLAGKPYKVVKYTHIKIGRGGAYVKLKIRNLESGGLEEKTFNSTTKVEEISTKKTKMEFLYKQGDSAVFMDSKTFEQVEVPISLINEKLKFIKNAQSVDVLIWNEKVLDVEIPPKVEFKIKDTVPGVKGNSASNVYKDAVLENGLKVKVPLFIKIGDRVRVDTRTGNYVERVTQISTRKQLKQL